MLTFLPLSFYNGSKGGIFMKLGQKLKEARVSAGLKQEELAQKLGVSRQTISSWENDRSYPDLGSAVKLSDLYGRSMDEMLRDDTSVLQAFEDLAAKRRKFWQMMLEIGIIVQLVGMLLAGQKFTFSANLFFLPGLALTYVAIFMHLRVFHHDRGEMIRGILGSVIHIGCNLLRVMGIDSLAVDMVSLIGLLLFWSAGVWTVDWKSPRLWLIIALYIGTPFLNIGTVLQDTGNLNTANPFGKNYQIEEVLYPEGSTVPEYTKIKLYSAVSYVEDRNGDSEELARFVYSEPVEGQTQKGIWLAVPEKNPDALYKLTVEADDSIILSYYQQEQLLWRGLLTNYGRDTCVITVPTFGSTMQMRPDWYAPGREDPQPGGRADVVGSATLNIAVFGLDTENLTLYEEYHHGDDIEATTYTLEPKKPGSFSLKLKTRYDGESEWALYRIPYQDGEYRFILTFG